MKHPHTPVLVEEVVKHLVHTREGTYVDGTAGPGGHSEAILHRLGGRGRLICLDRDPDAVCLCSRRLAGFPNAIVVRANFARMDEVLKGLGIEKVEGVFLDLGMSSYQIEESGRGFSFSRREPLDMRMNPDNERTAADLVNRLPPLELESILREYGEEKRARTIAKAIVAARKKEPIETAPRLAAIIEAAVPPSRRRRSRHPATQTFQALRVAVNQELRHLDVFLDKIPSLLAIGGRLVVLSYHSLEDRRVKQAMQGWEQTCSCPSDFPRCVCGRVPLFRRLFKKGRRPGPEEVFSNPRARSAVLRAAERIPAP